MKSKIYLRCIVVLILSLVCGVFAAQAQTTEFTYQGRLTDGGMSPTGSYDFEFRLYDETNTLLGTQTRSGVAVVSGAFTVGLDFGAQFSGAARSLEIAVRPAGGGAYTTLNPRQPITSAPYAIRSLNAGIADNANQLGGIPSAQFLQSDAGGNVQIGGNLTVNGTLTQAIINATTEYRINNQRVLSASNDNAFVGFSAGAANTTGFFNSFFGANSGRLNTTGTGNSFFGYRSGANNTEASANSFFGREAGEQNTTGSGNSFFGAFVGNLNTTGLQNSFFGTRAGENNTTGLNNSFFGNVAGQNNTASSNSFFGSSAGRFTTTGTSNSFFGSSTGFNNTTGTNNSFFGMFAGDTNLTGGNNTIIGFNADVGANNLDFASAFGAGSVVNTSNTVVLGRNLDTVQIPGNLNLTGNFTGSFIIPAINGGTGLSSSGASGNFLRSNGTTWTSSPILASDLPDLSGSFINNSTDEQVNANFNIDGSGILSNLEVTGNALISGELTTSNLTVTGDGSFGGNVEGSIFNANSRFELNGQRFLTAPATNNFFAGINTGPTTSPGTRNTYIGNLTAPTNTNGDNNVFIGYNVGQLTSNVDQSVFIGDRSGEATTTGDANTFVGYWAGKDVTNAQANTFVGLLAGGNITSGQNNTALGANTDLGINVNFATAIGSGASVFTSATIALGRANGSDTVIIPGNLIVEGTITNNLNAAQNTAVAEKVQTQEAQIKTLQDQNQKQNEQLQQQQQQIEQQQLVIDGLRKLLCQTNPNAEICKEKQK